MSEPLSSGKRAAARAVADTVRDGAQLGLGTGSTVAFFLERLAERIREERIQLVGIATSDSTAARAHQLGIPLGFIEGIDRLELAVDGADEIDPALDLIKGGGAALTREKIVAAAADRFIVIADESKLVARLGATFRLPIEILEFGWRQTAAHITAIGLPNSLRLDDDGFPLLTDNRNYVLDADLAPETDLRALEREIDRIPGVIECGLFLGMAHAAFIGDAHGHVRILERKPN